MTSNGRSLPPRTHRSRRETGIFFINAAFSDVQLYRHQSLRLQGHLTSIPASLAQWANGIPQTVLVSQADLVQYCKHDIMLFGGPRFSKYFFFVFFLFFCMIDNRCLLSSRYCPPRVGYV